MQIYILFSEKSEIKAYFYDFYKTGRMTLLRIYIGLMALCLTNIAYSQRYTLQGHVSDSLTNLPLSGASILIDEHNIKEIADENGDFSLTLPQGSYTITVSYVGYRTYVRKLLAGSGRQLRIRMVSDVSLQEVVVSAQRKDEQLTRMYMGVEKLSIEEVRKAPSLMGEVDILKTLQLLPGVQAASEGGSGFSVRGGSPDQNLILLDNTTVYNPSHLMGFFSIFNNDVIQDLELYKGDIPFKHGGRLSSLLDVHTKSEVPAKFQATGGIGLISSRLMLEGPLGSKTSWLVGGRRSYADLFLKLSSNASLRRSAVYFYDFNAKLSHLFSDRDKLDFNSYFGNDYFGADPGEFIYGNSAVSLTWNHVFSEKVFAKFSLNYTHYDYEVASKLEGSKVRWESAIKDFMLRMDFNHRLNDSWSLNYGLSTILHRFKPGLVLVENMDPYQVDGNNALEHAFYGGIEQQLTDKFCVKYGIRWSVFQNIGKATVFNYDAQHESIDSTVYKSGRIYHTYQAFEPRIGLTYRINELSSFKANYVRNIQYLQLANNSASGSPLDVWFSAGVNVKPQQVDAISVGYFRNFANHVYESSVEVYYKRLRNVIDFADHANLMLNQKMEGEIRTGTGKAYGMEWMLKKNSGALTGFVNYTLSRSERTIPEINDGKTYLAPYDKTHSINVVASYAFSERLNFSATWVFATGNPTTYPTGRFELNGEYFPVYSGRNEYRKPNYDRLDLSLSYFPRPKPGKRWKSEWNISVYNAYGRKNPWMITYNQDDETGLPYAEQLYLFGIVPSITYNFKF
jgi:hypothetical protein